MNKMADNDEMEVLDEIQEENDNSGCDEGMEEEKPPEVFIPGKTQHEEGELESDPSAYVFLHQLQAGAPCLSFDIIPDALGDRREQCPLTCYILSGTQSERGQPNYINIMKMHNITKTQKDEEDEEESDDDSADEEDEDEQPKLSLVTIQHTGAVNRVRVAKVDNKIYAGTWSEVGSVYIHDITEQTAMVDDPVAADKYDSKQTSVVQTLTQHSSEGFAIDWSPAAKGWLATGDCSSGIYVWQPSNSGWVTGKSPFTGHTDSVEDIQWSKNESNVFASCSVDRSIRIWHTQQKPTKANVLTVSEAHNRDINVIHWNPNEKHLLASGGDDGVIKIWDLRMFRNQPVTPTATFKLHTQPITSLEWNPLDSSVLAVSGADDQITIWDFSVERDEGPEEEEPDVPPQLLFQHCGQTDMKELHWHPQLPGVIISTAQSDFNIFRTISV
ncbi:glutamate-rich WD repeat-containing protein 1-like [Littorina saxatilis]|uniref:Glutamate-rich WD repeat-containing protein 1 n=1 Tax=Littorina saxatilis TaxID=31220 RepID=A0AAN9GKT7_9CAEN